MQSPHFSAQFIFLVFFFLYIFHSYYIILFVNTDENVLLFLVEPNRIVILRHIFLKTHHLL
jgi:hypothetical protein